MIEKLNKKGKFTDEQLDKISKLNDSKQALLKSVEIIDKEIEKFRLENPLTHEEIIEMMSFEQNGQITIGNSNLVNFLVAYYSLIPEQAIQLSRRLVNDSFKKKIILG